MDDNFSTQGARKKIPNNWVAFLIGKDSQADSKSISNWVATLTLQLEGVAVGQQVSSPI